MRFKEGSRVSWISTSNGIRKAKTGTVVRVVPAGKEINPFLVSVLEETDYSLQVSGNGPRSEVSYLVLGDEKKGFLNKLYWPRTCNLRSEKSKDQ